jgi:hypothetical protein
MTAMRFALSLLALWASQCVAACNHQDVFVTFSFNQNTDDKSVEIPMDGTKVLSGVLPGKPVWFQFILNLCEFI